MNVVDFLFEHSSGLDKDFVLGVNETISYEELFSRVKNLSNSIFERIGGGNEILLLSENNVFFIVSYLAIMKSNNTVVLIEPRISEKDLEIILKKCDIKMFFVQDKFKIKVAENINIFTDTNLKSILKKEPSETISTKIPDCTPDSIAEIIFTSGSTGGKKGVMLSHKNIIANTTSIVKYLNLTKEDRIEAALPFFYCYGLSLLHTHLRVGGSMVLSNSIFLGSVINEIKKFKCTGFAGVPSTFQILINRTDFLNQEFPSLRYMTQAGGKLSNKFIEMVADSFPNKKFYVMYGATEASSRLSYLPPELVTKKLGSIGKGIPNVKLEVLNENGFLVKPNEVGEITAIGDNIMKGYYNDPDATSKILRNKRYYTGDLATLDDEGFIYIVGRSNKLIKSAGHRISPHEIEDILVLVKGVDGCVVMGVPDDIMGEAVTAAIETHKPHDELMKKVLIVSKKKLPSFKAPKNILFFDKFPMNPSNKVDLTELKRKIMSRLANSNGQNNI